MVYSSILRNFLVTILLTLFVFAGCSSSSDTVVSQAPAATPQVATINLTQVLLRAVPTEVTSQRFSGFDAQGVLRYGPETRAKAANIELTNVSTAVTRLQIEFLAGDTVIGLGNVAVTLLPGESITVNDPPFQDVVSALNAIQVSPGASTIADGTSQQFTALATFADNSQLDLSSSATWTSSNPAAVTIDANGLATAVGAGDSTITASVGPVTGTATLTVSGATISSIAVTPNTPAIAAGTDQQFTATATLTDNSTQDVTATATWSSGTTATATIQTSTDTTPGLATAVASGQTLITASIGGASGTATLTVNNATVTGVTVNPVNSTIADGTTQQFTATATFTSGPAQDVTSSATWTSSQEGFATITSPGGLATAVDPGTTSVTATFGNQSGSTNLTVTAATISTIQVTPGVPSIANGSTQQFTAMATLTDGSMQDVTSTAAWTSDTPATATIETVGQANPGLATSVGAGQSTIEATVGTVTGSATLNVGNASVTSIVVTPNTPTIADGTTQQFTATANFSSGPPQDVTSSATWTSNVQATATVVPGGLATAVDENGGTPTVITATFGGQSGNTNLTVTAATIDSIAVTPATPAIALGTTQQFVATATLSDSTTQIITSSATWDSDTPGTATVQTGAVNPGLATSVAPGQTLIIATDTASGISGSTTLTVTPATLTSLAINPPEALSAPGTTRQYQVIGTFSDASTQDLSSQVTWTSNNTDVFIANDNLGPNNVGAARIDLGTAAGSSATITATLGTLNSTSTLRINSFAYGASAGGFSNVSVFTIDPITGTLTEGTAVPSGSDPSSVTVDPSGRFVYVANEGSATISAFTIDPTTGALTAVGTAVGTGGSLPFTVTVDPSGRFAYVANPGVGSLVSVLTIDPTTGALTAGTAVRAGSRPFSVAVDPSGRFAYVANIGSDNVSAFTIDPTTGALTAAGTAVAAGDAPRSVTVDPSGRFVYVANAVSNTISVFTIDPTTGALTAVTAVPNGGGPISVTVDPSGRFAYVAHFSSNNVSVFTIDPTTGALTAGTAAPTGGRPQSVTVDPSGRFAYVASDGAGILVFTIDPATGALTPVTTLTGVRFPRSIITTP